MKRNLPLIIFMFYNYMIIEQLWEKSFLILDLNYYLGLNEIFTILK